MSPKGSKVGHGTRKWIIPGRSIVSMVAGAWTEGDLGTKLPIACMLC